MLPGNSQTLIHLKYATFGMIMIGEINLKGEISSFLNEDLSENLLDIILKYIGVCYFLRAAFNEISFLPISVHSK